MKELNQFTNLYQLSKTLRFELRPKMLKNNILLDADNDFLQEIIEKDKKIKAAYEGLKPIMDEIHEKVISKSLDSEDAKNIDFSNYFERYKNKENRSSEEKKLRELIGKTYHIGIKYIKEKAGVDEKNEPMFKNEGIKCLTEAGILKYIEKNIDEFVSKKYSKDEIQKQLRVFERFFTYFSGYNQNRKNYYSIEEKATAVATRIVHDNLPKFCDNCILFSHDRVVKKKKSNEKIIIPSRKDEYLNAYKFLKDNNRTTQIKDVETNAMIEAYPISEQIFDIFEFTKFLSQTGIEEYNKKIGHYNLLINLYNQARKEEKEFKKLPPFKTLHKQIGCGKKRTLFYALKYDKKAEQQAANDDTDEILNLEETLNGISDVGEKYFKKPFGTTDVQTIHDFIDWLEKIEDWDGIYWSKSAVDKISSLYLANWYDIRERLQINLQDKKQKQDYLSVASFDKRREEQLKINDAVELSGLFKLLDESNGNQEIEWSKIFFKEAILEDRKDVIKENISPSKNIINLICANMKELADDFCKESTDILAITDYTDEENISKIKNWLDTAKSLIWLIKYFDVKESKIKGNAINSELSNYLSVLLYSDDTKWFDWYDIVRNYLTKKTQDDVKENKLKLNFDKSNLLWGFVESKGKSATQYGAYIFRKINKEYEEKTGITEYEYFLGISKNQNLFSCDWSQELEHQKSRTGLSEFQRLNYYQLNPKTENSALKKFILQFAADNKELVKKIDQHFEEKFTNARTCVKALEGELQEHFYNLLNDGKFSLNKYDIVKGNPKLKLYGDNRYTLFSELFSDIQKKEFKYLYVNDREFFNVINGKKRNKKGELVEGSKLYFFKIHTKDLSFSENFAKGLRKKTMGNKNIHTLFFEYLMSGNQSVIDIGKGEIFFRESVSIEKKQIHRIGEKMINRREKNTGNTIPYKIHDELYQFVNGKKKTSELSKETQGYLDVNNKIDETRVIVKDVKYDIIKDKRFTEAKYQLHLSILLNLNLNQKNVTEKINDTFTRADDIQFLGIDRGEKHLIYYSLVDAKGNIIEQDNFDVINKKDYLQEINETAKIRRKKQENWQQKGNIKNLKDGYISLVIHEIIEKMKDKNGMYKPTFIVLEDLNSGFKRGRQKFEQQIYQKFELALAKKLNYLVDKNAKLGEITSVAKALQLTPPIENYQDIEGEKQVGVMLYARANYTSVTDPVTGWRKTIYLKKGNKKDIQDQISEKFTDIGFDGNDYYFEYKFPNNDFQKTWRLWSGKNGGSLERYRFKRGEDKNERIIEKYDIKKRLDALFKDFDASKSLLEQLKSKEISEIEGEKNAWESLRFTIELIQQIRNSGDTEKGQDENFLLSPVRNDQGEHFDSRHQNKENSKLPKDGDANGAYNIARKGIIMYEHVKQWIKDGKTNDLDLFISDEEWDLWLNDKEHWKSELEYYASKKKKNTKE
jgi:CRISPR-associated protein Cpf1